VYATPLVNKTWSQEGTKAPLKTYAVTTTLNSTVSTNSADGISVEDGAIFNSGTLTIVSRTF